MTGPFLNFVQMLPVLYEGYVSWKRISDFVCLPPHRHATIGAANKPGNPELVACARDACLGWTAEEAVLTSVTFDLAKGSITVVTGDTGSGKSTLLKTLVGEVNVLAGSVDVFTARTAFCDQNPFFLPNRTVRDQIIWDRIFDESLYSSVIRCCQLQTDIERWDYGDSLMLVNTAGAPLSGGQRKRLSLARSLYHEPELLILDDVFTGIDADTVGEMRTTLFGTDGFLRKRQGNMAIILSWSSGMY